MNRLVSIAMLLVLTGCEKTVPAAPTASTASAPAPAAPVKSHSAGVAAAQVIAPAEAAASVLALDAEGLRLFNAVSGASRLVPFGTGRPDALRALGAALRTPLRAQGDNPDCGASHATWDNGLTVWFARERFVGWSAGAGASPLSTASGVMVGSSRAELEGVHAVTIKQSTLGFEFSAGDLAGLLDSGAPDAKITRLWAGAVCNARQGAGGSWRNADVVLFRPTRV